jgi:hypothetical protein
VAAAWLLYAEVPRARDQMDRAHLEAGRVHEERLKKGGSSRIKR